MTFASAILLADAMHAGLDERHSQMLERTTQLAKCCPMADVCDAFCDGIKAMVHLGLQERADAIEALERDCEFAAYPSPLECFW